MLIVQIIFILLVLILTCISLAAFSRISEVDFDGIVHTGPYGTGVKRIWSYIHETHILVYYPISKAQWLKGFETPEDSFLPYKIWGDKQSPDIIGLATYVEGLFGGVRIESVLNAEFDFLGED